MVFIGHRLFLLKYANKEILRQQKTIEIEKGEKERKKKFSTHYVSLVEVVVNVLGEKSVPIICDRM